MEVGRFYARPGRRGWPRQAPTFAHVAASARVVGLPGGRAGAGHTRADRAWQGGAATSPRDSTTRMSAVLSAAPSVRSVSLEPSHLLRSSQPDDRASLDAG